MIWRTVRIFHISDENIPNIYSRNKLPHSEIPKKFFPRYSFSGSNTKMVEKTSCGYISNKNRNINEHGEFRSVKNKQDAARIQLPTRRGLNGWYTANCTCRF